MIMVRILALLLISAVPAFSQTDAVRDWLILGTFPNLDARTRLTQDYVGGESSLSPRGGEIVSGRQWLLYHSPREFVDFLWSDFDFAARERCVVYAAFFVRSPGPQSVRLLVGSDDAIAVWCNGNNVHTADVVRGLVADNDTVAIALNEGWNTVVLKIANNEGGYGASARFADGTGLVLTAENPLPALRPLTTARIQGTSQVLSFRFRLAERDAVVAAVDLPLHNAGSTPARNVVLEYSTGTADAVRSRPLSFAGGELKRVLHDFSWSEAVMIARAGKPLKVRIYHQEGDTSFTFPFAGDFLAKFFQPWDFDGWQSERPDEKREIRTRTFVVPDDLAGLKLRVAVDIGELWGSVSVNGRTVLPRFSGDSGELTLTSDAVRGEPFTVQVVVSSDSPLKKTIAFSSTFRPQSDRIERYLLDRRFAREIYGVVPGDQSEITGGILDRLQQHNLADLDALLKPFEERIAPFAGAAKSLRLHMIGNAHIDMAWLWRYTETIEVTRATFQSALDNLRRYPDFRFSHGQAHSYEWIESRYPEMFAEIRKYVQEGRWEITGGTWVESDGNMPSGESFARQYLYGKRYFKSRFGVDVINGYHPDTFGHAASLPQILSKSGMETYTFFRPGDAERMFWWETPDGSRVFAHHPSNWYGTWSGIPDTLWTSAEKTRKNFGVTDVVQFFGVGDHGGGPTRRQIEQIEQLSSIQLYPKTQMSSFGSFYSSLVPQRSSAPVERGEQNFVFEGCYTSQAAIKMNNRKAEALLPTAEIFAAIAMSYGAEYPGKKLEGAWHNVLFNQFHDILCGSSIHDVAIDADQFYAEAFSAANEVLSSSLQRIASNIGTQAKEKGAIPVVLFNPLSWTRSEPVRIVVRTVAGKEPRILDAKGRVVESQILDEKQDSATIMFNADGIPAVGYKTYWISHKKAESRPTSSSLVIGNRWLEVSVDARTGSVSRIFDKVANRELVKPGQNLNQLQIQDDDAPMSAWVIGLHGKPRVIGDPVYVQMIESGTVRKVIRSEYRYGQSTFIQDVLLYSDRAQVDFRFEADWHHRKQMLKIAFPLAVSADSVTCDIPFAAITRAADGREIVAQKWIDLSAAGYGLTLLNDSKYGFDVKDGVVRLTALRSPTDPDPRADEGRHEFHYALAPHQGGWREGQSVRKGYEFNTPVIPFLTTQHRGSLPSTFSFIQIDNPDLVLAAMKKSEDDNDLVVRVYESSGQAKRGTLSFWHPLNGVQATNLIEWNPQSLNTAVRNSRGLTLDWKPTEIKTLKLSMGKRK
jgi:alpha-mannosidase